MKQLLLPLAALLISTHARAGIIGVERFDYPDGPIAGKNGGTFWDWKNFPPAAHIGTPSAWQNHYGTPVIFSGELLTETSDLLRTYNGANESDGAVTDLTSTPSSENHVIYYRVTARTGATLPDFFGLSSYNFANEEVFFGKPGLEDNFGIYDFTYGMHRSSLPIATNTTYTLVARLDLANDVLKLYVNPDLRQPEASATAVVTVDYPATNWSTSIRLASGGGPAGTSAVAWDDLVVATSWNGLGTLGGTGGDYDGDGQSDAAEIVAGTDPENSSDYFHILSFAPFGPYWYKISFPTVPGRTYTLQTSTTLGNDWTQFAPSTNSADSFTFSTTPGDPKRFYRIQVSH